MHKRYLKDSVYGEIASLTKILSNGHRIEIVDLLANGEKTVEQITNETSMSFANASQHLQRLKRARLVNFRRDRNYVYYQLSNPYIYPVWKALREFSRYHVPEIERVLSMYRNSKSIDFLSLKDLEKVEPYTLIDVRPEVEYDTNHIEGAIHIEMTDLSSRMHLLDRNNTIITYCRGPFCTLADEAAELLIQNGFKAIRLEESVLDA